jgi:hypothetical protein
MRHFVILSATFTGWHVPNFENCDGTPDPKNPQPCPLVVHLPTGDLGDKELADPNGLKRAGWEERDVGKGITELLFRAGPPMVVCQYRGGALIGVGVSTLSGNGGGPGSLSVNGKRVTLPATDEAIVSVLGQPRVRR